MKRLAIKNNNINGIIVINKPKGWTSFDCVNKVRHILGVKKAGHTGTLDPNATGVLPICLGKATKAVSMVQEGEKIYKAEMIFGIETDTYDVTGEIIKDFRSNEEKMSFSETDLLSAIKKFEGEQDQLPPIYSAKKVNGKKLYEYARAGQDVEIRPTHIVIEKIDLLSFDGKRAEIRVYCSKGTYIRSLVHDIGIELKCYAAMGDLLRERTGQFSIEDSITLDEIKEDVIEENNEKIFTPFLQKKIIPVSQIFSYSILHVNEKYEKNAFNGMKLYADDFEENIENFSDDFYKIFLKEDFFIGIYKREDDYLVVHKMFLIDEAF